MLELFIMHDANDNHVCSHNESELAELFEDYHGTPVDPVLIYVVTLERPTPTPEVLKGTLTLVSA